MKKGKVFTKGQIGLAVMVFVLAGAVWLNTEYSKKQNNAKYMGETALVGSEEKGESGAAMVGAQIEEDYFTKAAADREKAYNDATETISECLLSTDQAVKQKAVEISNTIAKRKTDEAAVENLLKAKGYEKNLVIIGENSVTVVIEADTLTQDKTVQIQDAVLSLCSIELANIKIVTVK